MGYSAWTSAVDLRQDKPLYSDDASLQPIREEVLTLLADELGADVGQYNFYQLVELILRTLSVDPQSETWELNCDLIFSSDPSLGFPASDLTALDKINETALRLDVAFFGLNGAHSPLPGFLLEEIATEDESGVRRVFLDFFNHRLIALVYRVWRKYRYYIRFEEGAVDRVSAQLFALVGLADERLRGETPINWSKMLPYAGLLAGRGRSPQVVASIIAHCFDLPDVSIRQWIERKVDIAPEQQMCLGKANGSLGQDTVIGTTITDISSKFMVCIGGLSLERFNDFLPSGKDYKSMGKLVEFILREQLAFDVELTLAPEDVMPLRLGETRLGALGWSSFLGKSEGKQSVVLQIRS